MGPDMTRFIWQIIIYKFLVIDVQNAIVDGNATLDFQPIIDQVLQNTVDRIAMLQRQARSAGTPVFVVQHDGASDPRLAQGSQGWEIRRKVASIRGDIVINESHSDAFYQTDLTAQLEMRGVTHLIVIDSINHYCVDITVRRGVDYGYVVTLVADGHGTRDNGALGHDQNTAHLNILLGTIYDPETQLTVQTTKETSFS